MSAGIVGSTQSWRRAPGCDVAHCCLPCQQGNEASVSTIGDVAVFQDEGTLPEMKPRCCQVVVY